MVDKDYQQAYIYGLGMLTLALLDHNTIRLGSHAIIYNSINKKHEVFLEQVRMMRKGKKKHLSHNCILFKEATFAVNTAWNEGLSSSRGIEYTCEAIIMRLWYNNASELERNYSIKIEKILDIFKPTINLGVGRSSVKIANALMDSLDKALRLRSQQTQ